MKPSPPTAFAHAQEAVPRDAARQRREEAGALKRARGAAVLTLAVALLVAGIFFGGFLVFARTVSSLQPPTPLEADGIVVLTGGAERVSGAIDLLTAGKAGRLLISGVHPNTSARQIGKIVDAGPSLFDCCVDLDRRAANTIGNATETAKWVRENRFGSLIVVTSAYHMPRSMAELGHAMPGVRLLPYPVARSSLELDRWYENRETLALLLSEYVKYIAARARLTLTGGDAGEPVLASAAR